VNVVFAVSSVAALASIAWMIWHDYSRPWREFQTNYFNLRSAMAHFDVLGYETPQEQEKLARLQADVERADAEIAARGSREKELLEQQSTLSGQLQGIAIEYGNRNAEMQVRVFNYEEARTLKGERDPRTLRIKEENEAAAEALAGLKSRMNDLEDGLRAVNDGLKSLYQKRNDAKKALAAYEKGRADAERVETMYGPSPSRFLFNLPMLDFAAPRGAPGHQEIQQVFMKPVRFDYNFVDSYVTDRCITCHVSIDNPDMAVETFVARTAAGLRHADVRAAIERANKPLLRTLDRRLADAGRHVGFVVEDGVETEKIAPDDHERFIRAMVRAANGYLIEIERPAISVEAMLASIDTSEGLTRGRVTDAIVARVKNVLLAMPPTDPVTDAPLDVRDMTDEQREDYILAMTSAMNGYLSQVGRPTIRFSPEVRAHPDLELYLAADSPHPIRQMGCTVCHEGAGQDTDFILAAHTPRDEAQKREWKEKYYDREMGIPLATFHLVEEFWERPMLLPQYTSAGCRKCHQQALDLEYDRTMPLASARPLVEGRKLFTTVGCINCHNVDGLNESRQVGTDLSHVGEKLTEGFIHRWVEYPANFRPSTWMPHLFQQENNVAADANEYDPDPVLRTETEIQAITHYLLTFSRPVAAVFPLPEGVTGDPTRGEALFVSIGCLACHVNLAAKDPLSDDGLSFGEAWITRDLSVMEGLSAEEAKARFDDMSANDGARHAFRRLTAERRRRAQAIAVREQLEAEQQQRDPDPKKLYVPPAYTRAAPELSGIGTKLAPDPDDGEQVERGRRWLYNWLREPRHYSSYTKMPRLFRDDYYQDLGPDQRRMQNDQDMMDVTEFLLAMRHDTFEAAPIPDDARHEQMRDDLILTLLLGQNTESVSEKILNDEKLDEADAYGRLTSAVVNQAYGAFGDDAEEAKRRVAEWIARKSGSLKDRRKLYLGMKMISHYGCYACHAITGFEEATPPGTDLTLWAQKFMSQLDFAFFSPAFDHERAEQPEVFGKLYFETGDSDHLIRDIDGNAPTEVLHNHAAFAYHKLRNPRIWDRGKIKKPYEKLKMPNFFLSEDQARSLTTYLLSLRDANVFESVRVDPDKTVAGPVARGRALTDELNCIGCHAIESLEANIHQYYSSDATLNDNDPRGPRFMPPSLWGQGSKIKYDWLFSFLNNVEMLRPWLRARMPSFHLTEEQSTALVAYFAGVSQDESSALNESMAPVVKYLRQAHGGAEGGGDAGRDWFLDGKLEATAEFLAQYALDHKQIRPYDLDTSAAGSRNGIVDALAPTYEKIVQRAEFLSRLYDVRYPFADAASHVATGGAYERGKDFFLDLKCLACHVAGDPAAPGTTTDIKAPNFALTHRRLRYEWVVKWLQDPQALMPGTNMPQIFPGTTFHAQLGEQGRKAGEEKYGDTMEKQAELLVDFLYTLGAKGETVVQPGGVALPAAEESTEDVEFDFDGEGEEKEEETEFDF
jgi:mono/diheme cytochrome c family protein